jgi:alkylation response protein AidB-like acyl-CoA dehydrogenase
LNDLGELHDELRAVAREVLGRTGTAEPAWSRIAGLGWPGLEIPEALGGAGASFAEVAVVAEELGRAAAVVPYVGTVVMGAGTLLALERTSLRDELLAGVASGAVRLAVASGPTDGAGVGHPPFALGRRAGGLTVDGRADLVLDAPGADHLLLLAEGPDGGDAVVACVDPERLQVRDRPVVDVTRRFGEVTADGVDVDDTEVLRFAGAPVDCVHHQVDRAALAVACDGLGSAAAMLDATVAYVEQRQQFDRPIGSFQAVKHMCADMLVQLTVGRELVADAVEALVASRPDAGVAVARAKSFVGAAAVDVVGTAMQLHGGIGYTWESGIHVHLKRVIMDRSLFGSPAAHRRRVALHVVRTAGVST